MQVQEFMVLEKKLREANGQLAQAFDQNEKLVIEVGLSGSSGFGR